MKRMIAMCSGLAVLAIGAALLTIPVIAQQGSGQGEAMGKAPAQGASKKEQKQDRVEGVVTRLNKDKKMLTVRHRTSNLEKTVVYDDSTQWTSQEHHGKKINAIDPGQVKDNDRVICLGTFDKKGVLHATFISKRLTE